MTRQTGFDITAASEVMAVLGLATSLQDLRVRLGRIAVGYTNDGKPVTAEELKAAGAMTVIMHEAIKPNLLQTLKNTPVLVHDGPFGNIATGNSSVVADLIGIRTGDFLITESGSGADMGAERFFNIKCRASGLRPDAAVVVTTVRALKAQSGRHRIVAGRSLPGAILEENPEGVHIGGSNAEIAESVGTRATVSRHFSEGGRGASELAEAVADATSQQSDFKMLYPADASLREKIETLAVVGPWVTDSGPQQPPKSARRHPGILRR